MADSKLTGLSAISQANVDDTALLYIVDVTGGNVSRKVTKGNLFAGTKTTQLVIGLPTGPTGSGSVFYAGIKIPQTTITFSGAAQTNDFYANSLDSAVLINPSAGTIPNAATLRIGGASIASTNVTITNNYALWIAAGNSLFSGNILTTNYTISDTTAAGASVVSLSRSTGNAAGGLAISPSGTTKQGGLYVFRTSDITTNYEVVMLISDFGVSNEHALYVNKGGTGSFRPLNIYNNETKLMSFDTAATVSIYVGTTISAQMTFSPTTNTALIVNLPTGPTGSSSAFYGGQKVAATTVAFATTAQTGDYTTNYIDQATLTNPSSGTITSASSLRIKGAPIASTNVTITNAYGLWVEAGNIRFGGDMYIIGKINQNANTNANSDNLNIIDFFGISSIPGFYTQQVQNIYYNVGWKSRQGGSGVMIELDGGVSQAQQIQFLIGDGSTSTTQGSAINLTPMLTLGTGGVTTFKGISTAGLGLAAVYGSTKQKSETGADANVLTYTPPAVAGTYLVKIAISVSAASAATLGVTITWKDSNGHAQAPTNIALTKVGTAAPALTFSAAANDTYECDCPIEIDNSATNIVVKTTFSGTSIAYKISAAVLQLA